MSAVLNSRLLIHTCKLKRPSPSLPLVAKTYIRKRRSTHDLGVERDNHEYSTYFVTSHRTFSAIHHKELAHYAAIPHRGVLPQSVFGIFALLNTLQLKVGLCCILSFQKARPERAPEQDDLSEQASLPKQILPIGQKTLVSLISSTSARGHKSVYHSETR